MERQGKNHRILIVDDEATIRLMLAYSLGAAGYDVVAAGSLGSAREALDLGYFSVVITDLCLSGRGPGDGMEVVRHAKECCPKTGVIVMSADLSDELRVKVRLLGASHCYEKPCDIDEMLGNIREITDRSEWYKKNSAIPAL